MKKIFLGMFVFGLFMVPLAATVSAYTDGQSPWENLKQFRGGEVKESARVLGMDKDDFLAHRNELREKHRGERMALRMERMSDAVERGCMTEEEMKERIQNRNHRFSN